MGMQNLKIILVALAVIAGVQQGHAGEHIWRVVSYTMEQGGLKKDREIVRRIGGNPKRVVWQDIPQLGWVPMLPPSPAEFEHAVIIEDRNFPPIMADFNISGGEEIKLSNRRALLFKLGLSGNIAASDSSMSDGDVPKKLDQRGVRDVSVEGEGLVVFDTKTRTSIAGHILITRRITPALWRNDIPQEELVSSVDVAWAEVP